MIEQSLSEQLLNIQVRLGDAVEQLQSVIGLEELDDAMKTISHLPCGVVVYSGDFPGQLADGRQQVKRYWSVLLVLDLKRDPAAALDLVHAVKSALIGFWPCKGVGILSLAGSRFVTKFDNARAVYEVRFTHDAWLVYDNLG